MICMKQNQGIDEISKLKTLKTQIEVLFFSLCFVNFYLTYLSQLKTDLAKQGLIIFITVVEIFKMGKEIRKFKNETVLKTLQL